MREEELKEIEDLAAKATPGPWRSVASLSMDGEVVSMREHMGGPTMSADIDGDLAHEDARFIARARSAVPALCAALRERDATIAQLNDRLNLAAALECEIRIDCGAYSDEDTGAAVRRALADREALITGAVPQ